MITVTNTIEEEILKLTVAADQLDADLDQAIEDELDALIARMRPETPVRSGDMQKGYRRDGFTMTNEMRYAKWVALTGTHRMHANPKLRRLLDQEDLELELALEASLARALGAP
jgi:hypothetical protein